MPMTTLKVFALVDPDGLIVNAFYWEADPASYPVQAGHTLVRIDTVENVGIGWRYLNGEFVAPNES